MKTLRELGRNIADTLSGIVDMLGACVLSALGCAAGVLIPALVVWLVCEVLELLTKMGG